MESLAACGADIESGEPRLAEDVDRFERELARANAEIAAEKVQSTTPEEKQPASTGPVVFPQIFVYRSLACL